MRPEAHLRELYPVNSGMTWRNSSRYVVRSRSDPPATADLSCLRAGRSCHGAEEASVAASRTLRSVPSARCRMPTLDRARGAGLRSLVVASRVPCRPRLHRRMIERSAFNECQRCESHPPSNSSASAKSNLMRDTESRYLSQGRQQESHPDRHDTCVRSRSAPCSRHTH